MGLLEDLMDYSSWKSSRENDLRAYRRQQESKRDATLRSLDTEAQNLRDEIDANLRQYGELKKIAMQGFDIALKRHAKEQLASAASDLKLEDYVSVGTPPSKSPTQLKQEMVALLRRNKDILDNLLPKNDDQHVEARRNCEADITAWREKEEAVDAVKINALIADYAASHAECLPAYEDMTDPSYPSDLPKEVVFGSYVIPSFGDLSDISSDSPLLLPYRLDLSAAASIFLKTDINDYQNVDRIEDELVGIALRILESYPAGQIKVGIFSPSLSSLTKLGALHASLVKANLSIVKQPCQSREDLARLLSEVETRANLVSAKLFENNCLDLPSLYERGVRTEPFQLLIVHESLADMSPDVLNRLYGCASGLAKCGVRFLLIDDPNQESFRNKPQQFKIRLEQLMRCCTIFDVTGEYAKDESRYLVELPHLHPFISAQGVYNFVQKLFQHAEQKKPAFLTYEAVGFGKHDADPNEFSSIEIPCALDAPDVWEVAFDCVDKAPVANLVVGQPGTGKSTLIDALIMNGAMKYSPDELNFQLLDFKDGASSYVYTMEDCRIPHIKVVSQENKVEDAEIILSNILSESERRNREFKAFAKEAGVTIHNISEYNKHVKQMGGTRKSMPRLVIVIDECQCLFEEESLAAKCETIARKCRSHGIHLILATQTLSHKMHATTKFCKGIYCFYVDRGDAEQLFANRKYVPLVETEIPKGSYMAFASNDGGNNCSKIRVAYDGGQTAKYAKAIREKWSGYPISLVVIGDKGPCLIDRQDYDRFRGLCDEFEVPVGENYMDRGPVGVTYTMSHPMICLGTKELPGREMLKPFLVEASSKGIDTYLIDASRDQNLARFASGFGKENIHVGDERSYLDFLAKTIQIMQQRLANPRQEMTPVFFLIHGLSSIADFANDAKRVTSEPPAPMAAPVPGSLGSHIRSLTAARQNKETSVSGNKGLLNDLIPAAHRANIFLAFSLESLSLISNNGDQVFSFSNCGLLSSCDYKFLSLQCSDEARKIMPSSFKEKMLQGLSENMSFLSTEDGYAKLRFYQWKEGE